MNRAPCTVLLAAALAGACSAPRPAAEAPPLRDMEEPLALLDEPDDEEQRLALEPGGFTGVHVADARGSLDALVGGSEGLAVARVVENSPAQAAGIEAGDVLLAYRVDGGEELLEWPSQWRALERDTPPGTAVTLVIDRAGRELERTVEVVARVAPPERLRPARLREDRRVGLAVRGATEVEAAAAGIGPGAGAVVVGLARSSPWRAAGIVYEDLIVAVDGEPVAHPQALLDAIRAADAGGALGLELVRGGERRTVAAPLARRAHELKHVRIPVLFSYEREPRASETSVLLGLVRVRRTEAAWDVRLLWLVSFGGGDADRLERVE